MTAITSVALEVPDAEAAAAFYAAFGVGDHVGFRTSEAPTTGFRGYTLSLVVSRPNIVDTSIGAALDGGATPLKPAKKRFWGTGSHGIVIGSDAGAFTDPDGFAWETATG